MKKNNLVIYFQLLKEKYTKLKSSLAVRQVLEQEEMNGAILLNRFRYFFTAIMFVVGIGIAENLQNSLLNISMVGIYAIFNIAHTFVLNSKNLKRIHNSNSLSIVGDYLLFIGIIYYYWRTLSPDNFVFFLKNPGMFILILPILITTLQFRFKLFFVSFLLLMVIFLILIVYGVNSNMPLTNRWYDYILGDSIFLQAHIVIYFFFYTSVSLITGYTIYRTIVMIDKIGRAELKNASLARYFSPNVVKEITENPDQIFKGKRQKVTVLFSDIRSFTSISESLSPDELVLLLNDIRKIQIDSIFKFKGTLDKFIGDAVMATFGTPIPSSDALEDSNNSVLCAIEMLEQLDEFNLARANIGLQGISVGIGIHTGEAFTGNIGTEQRLEYTVIGDTVNTASRIESLCKPFEAKLLVSESTFLELRNDYKAEKLPLTEVKGKEKPIQVYKLA